MALPTNRRPAPAGRRPEDAPSLSVVPNSRPAEVEPEAGLPDALACAVLDKTTAPPKNPKPSMHEPKKPAPQPSTEPEETTPTSEETEESTEVAVVEGRSAADADRAIRWLGVTYRPPDVWRERQPSLREEWEFVMDGSHLPEQGPWRAAARGYAAPAIGLITVLHVLIWVLRSPARHATAWAVVLLVAASAHLML